jgi:cysteine synthase
MTTTVFSPPSLLELIGNTPLIRVGELYAKAEFANPSGSVKDRAAARIIDEGERNGRLRQGKVILDATVA